MGSGRSAFCSALLLVTQTCICANTGAPLRLPAQTSEGQHGSHPSPAGMEELPGALRVSLARWILHRVGFQALGSACVRSPVLLTHSEVFAGN